MLKKILNRKWFKILLLLVGFVVFDFLLNYTLYNPSFMTPIYGFALDNHLINEGGGGYPLLKISTLNRGLFAGPRAAVVGAVDYIQPSSDGDVHINIKAKDGVLVTETIQELPLSLPKLGDTVRIWGVTRYDISHRWWEIHPVIGWKKIN